MVTAACDMSHILARPCYSLTQFVEFGASKLAEEDASVDDVHLLIFQKHCLAYANRDQLLFQALILLHLKVLEEEIDDSMLRDLRSVVTSSSANPGLRTDSIIFCFLFVKNH